MNILLAAILSELTFIIGFIIIYFIVRLLHFPYSLLQIKNRYRWMSDGLLTGFFVILLTCFVTSRILRLNTYSEFQVILVALILPFIGEIGYHLFFSRRKTTLLVGRLHLAMKAFVQRGEFAVNFHSVTEEMVKTMLIVTSKIKNP